MFHFGLYYQTIEINYDLAKKYLLMAIDKGRGASNAMYWLGSYYQRIEENYDLMKKYYLMAIRRGCFRAMNDLICYYKCITPNNDDMQNYLFAIIKGNIRFREIYIFNNPSSFCVGKYIIIDAFCNIINDVNHISLNIKDFSFCVLKIINHIRKSDYKLNNINIFMKCVCKIYYSHNKKDKSKNEYRRCVKQIFNSDKHISQLFMEYLDFNYYKYLDEKFAPYPPGSGYIKTKKHFESIADAIAIAKSKKYNIAKK
jgi:hypothetical protein